MLDTVLLARDKWLKPTGCGKIHVDILNDKFQSLQGRGGSPDPASSLFFQENLASRIPIAKANKFKIYIDPFD